MNISNHPSGFLRRSRVLIILCAVVALYSCSSTMKIKYVNWDIEFTKGASEQDKDVAMDSIHRYILYHLAEEDYTGYIIKNITFTIPAYRDRDRTSVGVSISLGNAAGGAVAPVKPGTGPHQPFGTPDRPTYPNVNIKSSGSE